MSSSERETSEKATRDRPILLAILATIGMTLVYAISMLIKMLLGIIKNK